MHNQSSRHLIENEIIFREANKDVQEFLQDSAVGPDQVVAFFCECSRADCRSRITLTPKQYQELHQNERQFIILPGHEMPQLETVVRREPNFSLVEKYGDLPSSNDIEMALKAIQPYLP